MLELSGIVTSATNAALVTQPGVALAVSSAVGGTGVCVVGMGVPVAGGGSVLTRTPLNGGSVSVGTGVGLGAAVQAASKTANKVISIHFSFIP